LRFVDPSGLDCEFSGGTILFDYELGDDPKTGCLQAGGAYTPPGGIDVNSSDPSGGSYPSPDPGSVPTQDPSGGNGGGVGGNSAPNNDPDNARILALAQGISRDTKFAKCFDETLGKNGVSLGLDAAGFIPGEGLAHAGYQYVIALASSGNSIMHGDIVGRNMGAAGSAVSLVDAVNNIEPGAPAWAKAVPFVGTIVNGIATAHDLSSAYKDYQACMSHP
jgi:hypothetical protein